MNQGFVALPAVVGIFVGALTADLFVSDGIQAEDMLQAMFMALIAGGLQLWLISNRRP